MSSEALTLLIIWAVAVVAFFALWAILAKVVHKISERKRHGEDAIREESAGEKASTESGT